MAKQKYRVGERGYRGHKAGDVVELDLTDEQQKRFVDRGSLEHVRADTKTTEAREEN